MFQKVSWWQALLVLGFTLWMIDPENRIRLLLWLFAAVFVIIVLRFFWAMVRLLLD
ncbi:MAG: hypothetical protein N3A55_08720 [Methylohalobius sp.]|nr:hypothetical protein [Anaerolineales bacterium]MCX8049720.1 hypothetical protein [Methylohalobius sp.]